MKWSKYNYLFETNSKFLLYNSLSNCFAELDRDTYVYLKELINKNTIIIEDEELKEELLSIKCLTNSELDEINETKFLTHLSRFDNRNLLLTINPTLHCNFSCSYCFESKRPPIYMTDEVEDLIINYVNKQKQAEFIDVTWFGGEPLMAFDRIVSLSKKLKNIKKNYSASIITNGYLLSRKVIEKLDDLNIHFIQITIDGLSKTHNSRRYLSTGKGTFEKIVKNIELLKELNPSIDLAIRVNIDNNNKDEFISIYNFFQDKKFDKTNITPAFVDDITSCKISDCLFDRKRKIQFILEMQKKHNFDFSYFYPSYNRYECAVRNPNCVTIGPKGELYKCWNDVGNEDRIIAKLDNSIKINKNLLLRYLVGADPLEDNNCRSCFHLPTCGGGCPYLRIENEYNNRDFDTCDFIKGNIKEFLEIHYQNHLNKLQQ